MKIKDKVLIVEDEQSISNFISMILTANGYDTIIVRSGEEALTHDLLALPGISIVLDLGLPDMDGHGGAARAVRSWSNLPVVVVSARSHGARQGLEALDLRRGRLPRPSRSAPPELLARVRTAIRHTRTASATSCRSPAVGHATRSAS